MDEHRLEQLLAGNNPLHPLELSFLRQDVQAREDTIQKLQTQIDALKSQCQARKSLLSPLRRSVLPPELLGEVFCQVLETSHLDETDQVVNICLVCKVWRDVALATPRLWTSAKVEFPEEGAFEKVEAWLSRSCVLPKRLQVSGVGLWGDETHECSLSTSDLPIFLAQGPSLEKLSLKCHFPKCCLGLLESILAIETLTPRAWDLLQALDLDFSSDWGDEGAAFFHLLPHSLKSLSFNLPYFEELPNQGLRPRPVSHPSVSTLKITTGFWPAQWILKTLTGFPKLSEITLDFQGTYLPFSEGPFHGDEPFTFPTVQSLKLHNLYWPQSDRTRILRAFSAPSLTELELSFETDEEDDPDEPDLLDMRADVAEFARISGNLTLLRSLKLQGFAVTGVGLNHILKSFPSITRLALQAVLIYGRSPNGLGFEQDVLSQLQMLELFDWPGQDRDVVSLDVVMKFIQTRNAHPASKVPSFDATKIRKVTLSIAHPGCSTRDFDPKRWLKAMEDQGVQFLFVSS